MKCAIIGIGQLGRSLSLELAAAGHEVSCIDLVMQNLAQVRDHVTMAVQADATDSDVLSQLGLEEMDVVVVAIGESFEASILITALLRKLGVKRLHVRVINEVHEHLLDLMNVDGKIRAEHMAAQALARSLANEAVFGHFGLDASHAVAEVPVPEALIGKRLAESRLREDFRLNLITLRRRPPDGWKDLNATAWSVVGVPTPDLVFEDGDHLIVFATEKDLERFTKRRTG